MYILSSFRIRYKVSGIIILPGELLAGGYLTSTQKRISGKNPEEDFLSHHPKFTSCGEKDSFPFDLKRIALESYPCKVKERYLPKFTCFQVESPHELVAHVLCRMNCCIIVPLPW